MSNSKKAMTIEFSKNLEVIASNFINCFALRYKREIPNLSDYLFRWMDFRLRFIDPKPRAVYLSKKLQRVLPNAVKQPLNNLFYMIQNGCDINPYQGRGLILHHDTSGRKRQNRTDLLWADWGIIHLHITNKTIAHGRYFCEPSDWLLFAMIGADYIACIDVRLHKEVNVFSAPDLFHIAVDSWPEMMDAYKLRGIHSSREPYTAEEHALLRKNGITGLVSIGNDVYISPGMGITGASTSDKVTMRTNDIIRYTHELAGLVCNPREQFQKEVNGCACKDPRFTLCVTPLGLAVYESTMDKAWPLPRKEVHAESNYLADLHELLSPMWAVRQLIAATEKDMTRER